MKILYLAHPVGGDLLGNCSRALRWLRWLHNGLPAGYMVIAPWIAGVMSGDDDTNPAVREWALQGCEEVVSRCDGLVLCGGRLSAGMARECGTAARQGIPLYDLLWLGELPPDNHDALGLFPAKEAP